MRIVGAILSVLFLFGVPVPALALQRRSLIVDLGASLTFPQIAANATRTLVAAIVLLCITLFLLGAFVMVLSRGKEDQLQKGKDLMIWSLVGMAVVIGSYAIIRTLYSVFF